MSDWDFWAGLAAGFFAGASTMWAHYHQRGRVKIVQTFAVADTSATVTAEAENAEAALAIVERAKRLVQALQ